MSVTSNNDETIDSRDIIERIEELEGNQDSLTNDEAEELAILLELQQEAKGADDWEHGVTLIRETYFTDYCKEMLEDCGEIPRGLPWYIAIDWDETADNIRQDYWEVDYDGVTYLIR